MKGQPEIERTQVFKFLIPWFDPRYFDCFGNTDIDININVNNNLAPNLNSKFGNLYIQH